MKKSALITDIKGQDGFYLVEFLLDKGYIVYNIKRRALSFITERIDHLISNPNFQLNYVGLTDSSKTKAELGCGSQITAQEMYKSMLKEEYKTMRRLEFLKVYDLCFSLSIGSG